MILIKTERVTGQFEISNFDLFKTKLLGWAASYEVSCYLDSNQYIDDKYSSYNILVGVGNESQLSKSTNNSFEELKKYHALKRDWLFGFLAYDLKNEIEKLTSKNTDGLGFPEIHFFQPEIIIEWKDQRLNIHSLGPNPDSIFYAIQHFSNNENKVKVKAPILQSRISKEEYISAVKKIKNHIIEGDIYEMNFCQEFYAEDTSIDPLSIFKKLNSLAKAPFSCFYKIGDQFLICSSPERYLKKDGKSLISQPIKGTVKRGENKEEDNRLRAVLKASEKDQAENVMIVDLVRNDLASVSIPGSVKVETLFGIYPFEQVHHMISTIKSTLKSEVHFVDAIRNTFPMGSMTGAPKVMAMKLIEHYEQTKRGLYSGAVGYITPEGDFDFNVVIRSILYNQANKYMSFQVGGAIVYDSVPALEYEECILKAKAILEVLESID